MDRKYKDNFSPKYNEEKKNHAAVQERDQVQQRFVQSHRVNDRIREAERDIDTDKIRRELKTAEAIGQRHVANDGLEVKRRH